MTLIVSLRIPDGIVIAGDSLATMMGMMQVKTEVQVKCPECGKEHNVEVDVPLPMMPSTTFSYAQKLAPFLGKYGVGTFGAGMLLGKSMYTLKGHKLRLFKVLKPYFVPILSILYS